MNKKDWKYLLTGSIVGIISYIGIATYFIIEAISYKGQYPYPTIAGDVNNWFDRFIVNGFIILGPLFPIFIILIILLIISIIKIKKK